MFIENQYIYEPKNFIMALIELTEYCKENKIGLKRTDESDGNYDFLVDFSADVLATLRIRRTRTLENREIVSVIFDVQAKHQKVTSKVTNVISGVGRLVGGGLGAFSSAITPGVGWMLGGAITTATYGIGGIPGWVIGKIDDGLSKALVEGCNKHLSAMLNLFKDNLVDLTYILEKNESYRDEWMEFYLSEHPEDNQGKKVKDEETFKKIENEWINFCVNPIYEEEYKKRCELQDDSKTLEDLKKELLKKLKY